MNIKTKKQNPDGIVRLETSGELKEIIINEDFLNPNDASIALCFRGKNSSGIVELTPNEIQILSKKLIPKMHLLKDIKVMKFKK
ncbi:MAG: hypothetical protein KJ646_05865 [Nanoarchaeota archaeon]|nr:hypothetical protein [Nanoarchaeota archaeon]MBU4116393.1 hypothetical protein [Nanoarchaeota archaeon]